MRKCSFIIFSVLIHCTVLFLVFSPLLSCLGVVFPLCCPALLHIARGSWLAWALFSLAVSQLSLSR
ncbi:hypothetical protein B0H66DRAFT_550671 [Apodospora peruviana]|uniref:Uncharacterized protein n=1 Tax=Apodospora peruviana TaxID=516989 RepID=A0AAE0MBG9_9PEZI|nr:hypothetical protein B0H66DRAFT_550671 [Apodospora peruviana]